MARTTKKLATKKTATKKRAVKKAATKKRAVKKTATTKAATKKRGNALTIAKRVLATAQKKVVSTRKAFEKALLVRDKAAARVGALEAKAGMKSSAI